VHVVRGALALPTPEEREELYVIRADDHGVYYFVEGSGGVLAREGREIVVDPLPGPAREGFHNLVAGIGMGLVLHQRGAFTLHASAVALGGKAVAFVGWKGMGKSTTAAALYGRGHRLVTDDLLVVQLGGAEVTVLPGFPSMKLWPEAARAALGDDPETLPRLHPEAEKRGRRARADFAAAPLPLGAIYVLDYAAPGAGLRIEPLSAREACIELVRHAFALRILGEAGESPLLFRQRVELVRRVPVRRLSRERRLASLSDITEQVEKDIAALSASATGSV
jgi:hypothetical protein